LSVSVNELLVGSSCIGPAGQFIICKSLQVISGTRNRRIIGIICRACRKQLKPPFKAESCTQGCSSCICITIVVLNNQVAVVNYRGQLVDEVIKGLFECASRQLHFGFGICIPVLGFFDQSEASEFHKYFTVEICPEESCLIHALVVPAIRVFCLVLSYFGHECIEPPDRGINGLPAYICGRTCLSEPYRTAGAGWRGHLS